MDREETKRMLMDHLADEWCVIPCRAETVYDESKTYVDENGEEHRAIAKNSVGVELKAKLALVRWKDITKTTEPMLDGWLDQFPGCMWAVLTGSRSGLLVLDLDRGHADGVDGVENFKRYCAEHGHSLPKTLTQRTHSGGIQMFFKLPHGGPEIKSFAGLLPGVDVRGERGYACIPPSVNQDSGGSYEWIYGEKEADAPDWLIGLIRAWKGPKSKQTMRGATAANVGGSDASAWGRKALEEEIAELEQTPQGERNQALNRAACKMGSIIAGGGLDEQEVRAALEQAASFIGLPEGEAVATINSGLRAGMANPRLPEARRENSIIPGNGPSLEPEPWGVPVPFDGMNTPDIKKEWLPPVLGDYCSALAEEKQVPFGLAFGMAISALAGVAQLRFKVNVRQGYSEGLNLYVICPLDPGNRKSAVVDSVLHPIRAWEKAQAAAMAPEIRRVESLRKTMEAAISERRKKAATAGDLAKMEAIQREIDDMEARLPEVPHVPRITADDTTPEALAVVMQGNWNAVIIVSAEGGIFDILAGRYSKAPNLDLFLKGHSGDMVRVDRKNGSPVLLDDPRITMGLSPQPCVLMRRQASEEFRGRGLDGRFAYLINETMLGRRKAEPDPMPEPIKTAYHQLIYRLLPESMEGDRPEQIAMTLDGDAYAEWLEFCGKVEAELKPGGQFDGMTDWGGKLTGLVVRLAGLMHLADGGDAGNSVISGHTMKGAVLLGFVLADHARAAYALMGTDTATERGKALLDWIRRTGIRSFSERDCFNEVRGQTTFSHVEGVREGLSELKERGFVREAIMPKRSGPGRSASQVWEVNPAIMEA